MQKRHLDRTLYFNELANTSREFYIDYVRQYYPLKEGCKILEVGCGDGGNLLPFAEIGCIVTGIDQSDVRVSKAISFFEPFNYRFNFIAINFFDFRGLKEDEKYDIILVHDVIEHIFQKDEFIKQINHFISENGVVFWRFPAWQMPFGGHQQICRNKICSKLPFIHLLPKRIYNALLSLFSEKQELIDELNDIKKCATSIEKFEKLIKTNNHTIIHRTLWFINPHYKQKFNLTPRRLFVFVSHLKYLRNFFTTSCFYLTKYK